MNKIQNISRVFQEQKRKKSHEEIELQLNSRLSFYYHLPAVEKFLEECLLLVNLNRFMPAGRNMGTWWKPASFTETLIIATALCNCTSPIFYDVKQIFNIKPRGFFIFSDFFLSKWFHSYFKQMHTKVIETKKYIVIKTKIQHSFNENKSSLRP